MAELCNSKIRSIEILGKMRLRSSALLLLIVLLPSLSAFGQINRLALGAHLDSRGAQLSFRVYSSRATRIELYLYAQSTDADEVAHLPLQRDAITSVWSTTLPLENIRQEFGIQDTIYFGYRAWGPNWPFDSAWTKGMAQFGHSK